MNGVAVAHWIKAFQCMPLEQRENRTYRRDECRQGGGGHRGTSSVLGGRAGWPSPLSPLPSYPRAGRQGGD